MRKDNPFSGTIDVGPLIDYIQDTIFEVNAKDYLKLYPEDKKVIDELRKLPKEPRDQIIVEAVNDKIRIHETNSFKELVEKQDK